MVWITGCDDHFDGYMPVKEIARNGFLIEQQATGELSGIEVRLSWGMSIMATSTVAAVRARSWGSGGPGKGRMPEPGGSISRLIRMMRWGIPSRSMSVTMQDGINCSVSSWRMLGSKNPGSTI